MKTVLFLTRHQPTPEMLEFFLNWCGYDQVVYDENLVNTPFASAQDAVERVKGWQAANPGNELVAIVAVLPIHMVNQVIGAFPNTPVLRAVMEKVSVQLDDGTGRDEYRWTGRFERIISVKIEVEPFVPPTKQE